MAGQKEHDFYKILSNVFIGKKVDGAKDNGFIRLMAIKGTYYKEVLSKQIDKKVQVDIKTEQEREEIFTQMYNFFSRYISDSGSVYFFNRDSLENVYQPIYKQGNDVALFWKTDELYYIKSERIWQNMSVTMNSDVDVAFDCGGLHQAGDNQKKSLSYTYQKLEQNNESDSRKLTLILNVEYSTKTKIEEIYKQAKADGFFPLKAEDIETAIQTYEKQSEVDYFINKDAKRFLMDQLEMYLYHYLFKNEETVYTENRVKQIQTIRGFCILVIDLVSQFENELKNMWEKPKFALDAQYVFTFDKIYNANKNFAKTLIQNLPTQQMTEWKELNFIDEAFTPDAVLRSEKMTSELNEQYAHLPIDTKHLDDKTKYQLLATFSNLDDVLNGELVRSDNWQALNTLQEKYAGKVKLIYIDPPYNTGNDDFSYKDQFHHAGWMTMMENRLTTARDMLSDDGVIFVQCDDNEQAYLKVLMDEIFGRDNAMISMVWLKGNAQNDADGIQKNHEYILCYFLKNVELKEDVFSEKNVLKDNIGYYYLGAGITTGGAGGTLNNRHNLGYSIYFHKNTGDFFALDDYDKELAKNSNEESIVYQDNQEYLSKGYSIIRPPQKKGKLGRWTWSYEKFNKEKHLIYINSETLSVQKKEYIQDETLIKNNKIIIKTEAPPKSFFEIASSSGTRHLNNIFGEKAFSNPKPEALIERIIQIATQPGDLVMDFFMGSGTTPAVAHKMGRRYIGVEFNDYFHTVSKPRMKKVLFGEQGGISKTQNYTGGGAFTYYHLEQYEDTLANVHYSSENLLTQHEGGYPFLADPKLSHVATNNNKSLSVNLTRLSFGSRICLPTTFSHLYGKAIKSITADTVTFTDNTAIMYDLQKMDNDQRVEFYKKLKRLLWWA